MPTEITATELTPMMAAFAAVAMLVLTAGVLCWLLAALRLAVGWRLLPVSVAPIATDLLRAFDASPGLPLMAWRARRPVPWALLDLIGVLFIFILATMAVSLALRQWSGLPAGTEIEKLTLDQRKMLIAANIAVSLLVLAISLPLIALRTGAGLRDFGWTLGLLGKDLRLGLIGFVMLAPPVYALQGVLVYFWKPSAHPLMEMFKSTPDAAFFATLVTAAVIVAPLAEELMFRVLFQGFLEKLATFRGPIYEIFLGSFGRIAPQVPLGSAAGAVLELPAAASIDPNPYAAPQFEPVDSGQVIPAIAASDDQPELSGLQSWVPIAISSIIFALLHYSHGPDWVALTLLAAGMGYLYQRTHSVVPSLIVHVLLNGLSMWGLWIQVYELKGPPL